MKMIKNKNKKPPARIDFQKKRTINSDFFFNLPNYIPVRDSKNISPVIFNSTGCLGGCGVIYEMINKSYTTS